MKSLGVTSLNYQAKKGAVLGEFLCNGSVAVLTVF